MTVDPSGTLSVMQAERRYLLLSGLQWLPIGLVIPVMVLLMRARAIELPVIGALFAVYTAAVIVLELPTGSLADVLGRRRTLILSRLLGIASLLGMAVAADPVAFGFVMIVSGTSRALQSGPLEAWYVDSVHRLDPEADVRRGISRAWAVEAAGIAIGAVVGGLLPTVAAGLPVAGLVVPLSVPYLVAAAVASAGLVAVAVLMVEPPGTGARPSPVGILRDVPATVRAGIRLAVRDRSIRLVIGAMAAFGFALIALEVLSPVQFADLLGGEERASGAYGVLVTLAFLGTAAGSASAPAAARWLGSGPRVAALMTALIAAALAGMAAGSEFLVIATLYIAVYLFAGVAGPLNHEALHQRVGPDQRATLLSVASLAQMAGALVGNLVIPALAAVSFGAGWLTAGAVVAVGAILLALLPAQVPTIAADPADARDVVEAAPG
jgi:MFS family permease